MAQACSDLRATLKTYRFERIQGSAYLCDSEDLGNLFDALNALKALPWFPPVVRDIRAFRVDQWSGFTDRIKRQ
ncbi:MAG: virulence factor [Hyphomicrobiaceae bacterium]